MNKSGAIKLSRTFFCFKMTSIVILFAITPSNAHIIAPKPPIIRNIVNVLAWNLNNLLDNLKSLGTIFLFKRSQRAEKCDKKDVYSKASRYTASSCLKLDNVSFWMGSQKNLRCMNLCSKNLKLHGFLMSLLLPTNKETDPCSGPLFIYTQIFSL